MHIRVFYSLLVLSLLEALLWSVPLCDNCAGAQEYIARENLNFGCADGYLPSYAPVGVNFHGVELGIKEIPPTLDQFTFNPDMDSETPKQLRLRIPFVRSISQRLDKRSRKTKARSTYKEVAVVETTAPPKAPKPLPSVNDVIAGGTARAASQATIHPLDTMKVRMQATDTVPVKAVVGRAQARFGSQMQAQVRTLYRGVGSAAGGAGIAIGAYFAFYGAATKFLQEHTELPVGAVAFAAGGFAAFSSSFVKVPLAVTIRSVQAGVYSSPLQAARSIVKATGPRGLLTGLLPTILEDIPDMAFKFASYEMMRTAHQAMTGRARGEASVQADLLMGGTAGAFAAASTTPFDVVKTRMMCTAASRPSVISAAKEVYKAGGSKAFFLGIGPRAASNGINSAIFFCFFEALRTVMAKQAEMRMRRQQTQEAELALASLSLSLAGKAHNDQ